MDQQTLERELIKFTKGSYFISAPKFAKFIGKDKAYAYNLLKGLDKLPGEKQGDKYFIRDVAKRTMEARRQ